MNKPQDCANCGATLTAKFCAQCGERRLTSRDYRVGHVFASAVQALTNADGTIFHTIKLLLTRPGLLTAEYMSGRRQPYLRPVPLFLIANLIFFLVHPLIPGDTLTTNLNNHAHLQPYSALIEGLIQHRLDKRNETFEALAAHFDPIAKESAKTLVIVMVPLFALLVAALEFRRRRYLVEHVIFALHFMAWWLLLIIVVLIVATLGLRALPPDAAPFLPKAIELAATLALLGAQAIYLYFALRNSYGDSAALATFKGVTASVAMIFLVIPLYRLLLFFATWLAL